MRLQQSLSAARIRASIAALSRGISGMSFATNFASERYLGARSRLSLDRLRVDSSSISRHSAAASSPAKWFRHKAHSISVTPPSSDSWRRAFPQHAVHRVSIVVAAGRTSVILVSFRSSCP